MLITNFWKSTIHLPKRMPTLTTMVVAVATEAPYLVEHLGNDERPMDEEATDVVGEVHYNSVDSRAKQMRRHASVQYDDS